MAFDYSSSFAGINNAINSFGKTLEDRRQRQSLADLGKQAIGGDYNAAAAAAFAAGEGGLGVGLLKLGQTQKQESDWLKNNPDVLGSPAATPGVSGPTAAVTPSTPQNLVPLFTQAESKYGLPGGYLPRVAQIESSNNPNARNPNSSAGGLFQFIDSTARNYGLANKFDPAAATDAAARLAVDNRAALRQALGRDPTAGELYLAHQQGAGGASKLLANPNARAVDVVGADAVRLNGGNPNMTAAEFASKWTRKVDAGQPVQMAQADAPNMPASDAVEAQGFAIPGSSEAVPQSIANDPRVVGLQKALAGAPERFKPSIQSRLSILVDELKAQRQQNAPTDVQRNYKAARDQGYQGSLLDYQKELRSQTNVNVDTRAEGEYAKANGKAISERFAKIVEEGDAANQEVGTLARIRELGGQIKNIGQGAALQGWLAERGIKVGPNVSEIEAYSALIDKLTPQQRIAGAGATSDYDARMFKNSLPGLMRTPGGNELILSTLEALNTYRRQRGDLVAESMANSDKPSDVIKRLRELPDPFAGFKEAAKGGFKNNPEPKPPSAPEAPSPMQGARQAPDGNWYVPDPGRPGKYLQVQ